ncbi:FKBP-type peptidyl-prolyl cis-trans isomerase [Larkinella bovis]|uniref:Peptidyl-prolyl cis-trans isomerase n=1 Tax=Larkinella bovis TaxID=683041 RepID=A0ABW0IGU8_9BACT
MKFKQLSILIAVLLVVGLASCTKFDDPSAGKAAENIQQIKDYLTANQLQDKVQSSLSGLYYILGNTSTSQKKATAGEELEFTYEIYYINPSGQAVLVDSTNKTKSAYIPFLSGVVIPGLEEGLLLMREGQSADFFIPSNIGFGNDTRNGKMPEYSPVIFKVKLIRSRTEAEQIDDYVQIKNLPALTTTTTGGTRVYHITKGTGATITSGETVTVAYTANTLRGKEPFDKGDALTFKTGSSQYITGFDEGIRSLRVGDKAILVFPSSAGYGSQGSFDQNKQYYVVPPYTPLAFEVTVKSKQ